MKLPRSSRVRTERGVSLVEIVVAGMLLSITLLGLSGAAGLAARQTYWAERDMELWAAVQWEVDSLMAVNWGALASGSDSVRGYPMSWTISGTDPKQINLVFGRMSSTTRSMVPDTLAFYIADPNPALNP